MIATDAANKALEDATNAWTEGEPNLVTFRDRPGQLIVRTVTGKDVAFYAVIEVTEPYPFRVELATIHRHGFMLRLTARLGATSLSTRDCRPGRPDRPQGLRRAEPSLYDGPHDLLITGRFAEDAANARAWLDQHAEAIVAADNNRENTASPLIHG